jgi:dTDP-4-dehydrorhamnose reductase
VFLITGGSGQLGHALQRALAARGEAATAFSHGELDIADADAIARAHDRCNARVVVNCAALTKVDGCERDPELAERVNARGPALLARACAARGRGAKLVLVCTEFVFAGDGERPYREDDPPAPRSVYGRSKLAGEHAALEAPGALVVRTSWVYGRGRNFPAAILAQAREGKPLRVVADQRGRPTYAADLADAILQLVAADARGIVNFANDGEATWLELARRVLDACGFAERPIQPLRTEELGLPAPRPRYSVLDLGRARALGVTPRDWRAALSVYLASEDAPAD